MSEVSEGPQGPIVAPDLDGAVEWLNVAAPLSLAQLRGKVVLIDFWTYGCVNCMHVLRDLKTLEARFPEELVVIGVHSPKFTNERSSDNLRRILVRYEIEHPVANDANHVIWRRYGAQAWPTRVIVDPAGNLVGTAMGEGNLAGFVNAIRGVIRVFDDPSPSLRAGHVPINRSPLPLDLERARHADRPLLYPGSVLADAAGRRLFIADSNHNRIVVSDLSQVESGFSRIVESGFSRIVESGFSRIESGFSRIVESGFSRIAESGFSRIVESGFSRITEIVGSGIQGGADGIFTQARFNRPHGLALDGDVLYVADTGNDQVRAIDFQTRAVHTVDVANLKSPWDIGLKKGILIVAMAGPHQIWVIDLLNDQAYPYAGTGEEARRDGAVSEAAFAQPSGVAIDGDTLYVADAESNTIREVRLPPANTVRTIAGGDLFEFGDRDGTGSAVRLQHPLGVAVHEGRVFIADTYNHKIKILDPVSGRVQTVAGTGSPGLADGPGPRAQFHEPGGLSIAGDTLFVADTNNHAIRAIDTRSFGVSTLALQGLAPPVAWSYLRPQK